VRHVKAFALFWWDFVVGDDYRLALGVVVLLALTAVLAHRGIPLWWLPPLGVLGLLVLSVAEAALAERRARGGGR
jgi:uncharacterized membrane protein